jgi:hypothetical protein
VEGGYRCTQCWRAKRKAHQVRWPSRSKRWAYELVAASKLKRLVDDWQARSGVEFLVTEKNLDKLRGENEELPEWEDIPMNGFQQVQQSSVRVAVSPNGTHGMVPPQRSAKGSIMV